jgi:hypothetical protein
MSSTNRSFEVLGWWILLCIIGVVVVNGYGWLDSAGWISHRVETAITSESSWIVGESKTCGSSPANYAGATAFGKRVGSTFAYVTCDDGPAHTITVTFWGRELQPDATIAIWKCTRLSGSFVCRQTGTN